MLGLHLLRVSVRNLLSVIGAGEGGVGHGEVGWVGVCLSYWNHESFGLCELLLISIKREELRHSEMECGSNMKNVKTAMASFDRVLERKAPSDLVHIRPIDCCMTIKSRLHI